MQLIDPYEGNSPILTAVDNIILGFDPNQEKLKVLLFKRITEPFAGQWSLIGSFVKANQHIDDAAADVLERLTGLKNIYLEQLQAYGHSQRDPARRVISIVYYSLLRLGHENLQLKEQHDSFWYPIDEVPALVLDHNQMLRDAIERLQEKARRKPIGFELLPEKLTLRALKTLYEQIFQQEIDDRNFRKKNISHRFVDQAE